MNDLINKKEALDLLRKRSQQLMGIYGDLGGALSGAARLIDELPTADRPQGEWIHSHEGTIAEGLYCSNCGKHGHGEIFCPNCRARMKGADDERP